MNASPAQIAQHGINIVFDDKEDKMRFISILCLARQRVQSKATLDMIADLLKELKEND